MSASIRNAAPALLALSDYAFFPLFPWLERLIGGVTGLSVVDAGLLVSWVALLSPPGGSSRSAPTCYDRRVGVLLVVLWAAIPVGIVLSMAYSESLFTALAAWSLYSVVTRHWIWAGVLASCAGMTRPVGLAVVAAVLIPAAVVLFRHRWQTSATTDRTPLGWRVLAARLRPALTLACRASGLEGLASQ